MTIANYITLSRIALIIPVLILVSYQENSYNWIALILFIVAGITDHVDGFIARRTGTTSQLGAILDLIADKLLICVPLIFLLSYFDNNILAFPVILIISRELIISAFRQFLAEKQGNNPIKVSFIAKSKTTAQITALSFLIISPNFGEYFYMLTIVLFWMAAYISIHSLLTYIKSYKYLIK
ncbi:CDP-diacylglycerol--glycerol-3-phosphate 3-phosphatidyltransferase [Gammaproteobacteria bacterium]|nr:CDP-diacylglycerol--glycerol-3-phosphate 3-phosphatidyltransferase [Gammaproteobacteria bacterium]